MMENEQLQEKFDTGLRNIGHEIKSRLVEHGLFGTVTTTPRGPGEAPDGMALEINAKGRAAGRSFDRQQIEGCYLRVGGAVLSDIIAMVDEVSAATLK
ncbi:MAG TPA: hypothetical protein VME42_00155 [Steroidobacteraceae bacterium]|nr:hypothetical protein [Steroidobacteraceae bacterium]